MALPSLFLVFMTSCVSSMRNPADAYVVKATEEGKASWYSIKTNRGTRTASGQKLCNQAPTAAHKTLPMGTKVRVINLANNKSEIVTINDRGPFKKGRVIDVTIGTAERLGFARYGIIPVRVEVLSPKGGGDS
jgi:rare lipoprotein A